ncbi:MAG: MBL fold metallo-hydrolase [Zoogloeaceae bacterium]|nr:MBL fold metallo-hydrolase [Zoogloeaceae bacterium]
MCLASCSSVNPYYDPAQPHHTQKGFRNLNAGFTPGTLDMLRWRYERWSENLPPPPREPVVGVPGDVPFLHETSNAIRMTWIGHSTLLMQIGDFNLLTDPMFSDRASPISFMGGHRRLQPPGVALADLPRIDVVVISHNHYDHLDLASVRALAAQKGGPPVFAVPLGVELWFRDNVSPSLDLRALDWWQQTVVKDVALTLTPAQHWSQRTLFDRNETLWGGWAVRARNPDFNFLFGGDSGYWDGFRATGERLGPFDLAALPIGAYLPRWFMRYAHMDPTEAVRSRDDLKAKAAMGVHWGTFTLTDEAPDQPPRDLAKARTEAGLGEADFFVMRHGETRILQNGQWTIHRPAAR